MQMRSTNRRSRTLETIFLISSITSLFLGVNTLPQWVWNKDAIDSSRLGNNEQFFVGHSSNIPQSPIRGVSSSSQRDIKIVNGQSRLFLPNPIGSISNSIQSIGGGGVGSGAGNAISGLFGSVLQNIPQLASQAISGLLGNRPSSLPAKDPGDVNAGQSVPVTNNCRCVSLNSCFLPSKPSGSCEGGKVQCCSTSRTVFPGETSPSSGTKNERTITQREIRRGLLQNILKGSGSVVDDTLDFLLQPFLSKEDQQKIATRIVENEQQ